MPRYASMPAAHRERVVGVAFGLLRLTLRDRHAGARGQRPHQPPAGRRRDGVVGPAAGRDQIPARQRGLRTAGAQHRRRRRRHDTHVLPGRLARVLRRRSIAGGQGRVRQRQVGDARGEPAKLGGGLEAASAAARAAPVSPWYASAVPWPARLMHPRRSRRELPRPRRPPRRIVRRLRPDRPGYICATPRHKRHWRESNRSPIASARSRPSSAAARAAIGSPATIAAARLPGEDLAEPPPIVQLPGPGRSPRRNTPGPARRCSQAAMAAGGQRPGQQGRVIDLARDRQGLLRLIQAVGGAHPMASMALSASARARTAAATPACCASRSARTVSNQASPSRRRPRACHSGCSDDASANASSTSEFSRLHAERGAQIVDLDVGLLEALLIITACRRVEQRPPSPCSNRGDASARRRPRRTRRVFPARTGAPSPAAGSGSGPRCRRPPPAICRPAG